MIVAAEARGFQREPDLYEGWYDHELHDDARFARDYLRARDPGALEDALVADECICPDCAARRITDSGHFTFGHVDLVLEAAIERGFTPPTADLPLMEYMVRWDQGRAAVAFFWERDPAQLAELIGDVARIAPLPPSARRPCGDRMGGPPVAVCSTGCYARDDGSRDLRP
ncbi:MAG: hypothetical protein ACRDKY_01645 [Solirubrobacteraceae bacterium]